MREREAAEREAAKRGRHNHGVDGPPEDAEEAVQQRRQQQLAHAVVVAPREEEGRAARLEESAEERGYVRTPPLVVRRRRRVADCSSRASGSAFTPWGEPSVDHLYHLDGADWQKQYDGVQHHAPRREGAFGIKTEYTSPFPRE